MFIPSQGYYDFGTRMYLDYFNLQPSEVKGSANITVDYEKRYLLQQLFSVYEFTLPEEWDLAFFRFFLFMYGTIAVIYERGVGWILSPYGITKLKRYYLPAMIQCYDVWTSRTLNGLIGYNAEIIHILDDRYGMNDILTRHATHLAQIDKLISINLMTSGTGYVYPAEGKKNGDTIKEAWDIASTGSPLVVVDVKDLKLDANSRNLLQPFNPEVSKNYIVDKLLIARRGVINSFLTKIGINNCNYEKKERLTESEVTQNDEEVDSISSVILKNLRDDFKRVKAISGLNLSVKLRGGEGNAIHVMGNDAVQRSAT